MAGHGERGASWRSTPSDQIIRIVLMDADGAETEFRFAGWKENLEISDSRFPITPPAGVRDG